MTYEETIERAKTAAELDAVALDWRTNPAEEENLHDSATALYCATYVEAYNSKRPKYPVRLLSFDHIGR